MLEPHVPHESIHSWKGFFIHIATIAIGLLIAIGLERVVDYVHHRQQLRDARVELSQELNDNRHILSLNKDFMARLKGELDADMALLMAAPLSRSTGSERLVYSWKGLAWPPAGAWQTLRQSGALSLMSHQDLARYNYFYDGVAALQDVLKDLAASLDLADAIARRSPDGSLRPTDISDLIAATSHCQGKLGYASTLLRIQESGLNNAPGPVVD